MKRTALIIAALAFAVFPLLSQTSTTKKPSFEVVSIKPNTPGPGPNFIGGGPRGDRYSMNGANLRMLLQQAYSRSFTGGGPGQIIQIIGGPNWMDSDRYDIQATADCSGGVLSREQLQLMIQSMLEDRFQLKAHMETRELPVYNLVVAKDGPKIKASEDQSPTPFAGGPPTPCGPAPAQLPPLPPPPAPGQRGGPADPNFVPPRGSMFMMMSPNGLTMQSAGVPIANLVNMLSQQVGRNIIDKTGLKGLFDFKSQFSR